MNICDAFVSITLYYSVVVVGSVVSLCIVFCKLKFSIFCMCSELFILILEVFVSFSCFCHVLFCFQTLQSERRKDAVIR